MEEDNLPKESAVEVTLPDDDTRVTEVKLEDKKAEIHEEQPKIEKKEPEPKTEEPQRQVDEREKALEDLKKQYLLQKQVAEAEREARKRAEMFAQEQARTAYSAQADVQTSNLRVLQNAIDTTEAAAAQAQRDLADAMAAGDWNTAAQAQRVMSEAAAQLLQLQNGKARLEEQLQPLAEGRVEEPKIPDFTPQLPKDPVEQYAERLTPKSAAWLRANPAAVEKIGKLTRAHADAVEDGITPESPEYFEFIESRLGITPRYDEEPPAAPRAAPAQPKKSMAAMPVTTSDSGGMGRNSGNSNTMVLSPNEVEVALLMEPELSREKAIESYARNKAMLIKQGKLTA